MTGSSAVPFETLADHDARCGCGEGYKHPRVARYEVTDLQGETPTNVRVGSILRDYDNGEERREWTILALGEGRWLGAIIGRRVGYV